MILVATFLEKLNIPHDFLCDEGSKNACFVEVRKVEGRKTPGHTVSYFKNWCSLITASSWMIKTRHSVSFLNVNVGIFQSG